MARDSTRGTVNVFGGCSPYNTTCERGVQQITNYTDADGIVISGLTLDTSGKRLLYVRGQAAGGNAASAAVPLTRATFAVPGPQYGCFSGRAPYQIAEHSMVASTPDAMRVLFALESDGFVTLAEFEENLLPKTRRKIELKLEGGWTFDKEKWQASLDRHAIGE